MDKILLLEKIRKKSLKHIKNIWSFIEISKKSGIIIKCIIIEWRWKYEQN